MENSLINEINFKGNNLFSPNKIMETAYEPTLLIADSKKDLIHEEGMLSIEKNGDFEKFVFNKGSGEVVTLMLGEKETVIAFEKNKEGEHTNSLFLFNKKVNRDSITEDNVQDLFKPENANQAMVLNKKPQGTESVMNVVSNNGVESKGTTFSGKLADFLQNNDCVPDKLDLINHVKYTNRQSFKNN